MALSLISIVAWIPSLLVKGILYLLGFIIVPVCFKLKLDLPKVYRGTPGRPHTIWELAVRNPVDGFKRLIDHPKRQEVKQKGDVEEPHLTDSKFQWRWRRWKWLSSIRLVWKYNQKRYGEFYFGWKLNSEPPDLDFGVQFRPFGKVGN